MNVFLEFAGFFGFILVPGYLLPAGLNYWFYHVRDFEHKDQLRLQDRLPTRRQIAREVKLSLLTIAIFAAGSTALLHLYRAGYTNVYFKLGSYFIGYFFVSVFLAVVLLDTYFYWTHRFMHWRPVFKYMHLGHHRSVNPTPWSIYAFQPLEAVVQFLGVGLIVAILPMHPLAILLFLFLDTQMNTGGHTGFEIVPRSISRQRWFQGFNTVAHHDAHHTNMHRNFGAFFNVWDRWMGTFLDSQAPTVDEDNPAPTVGDGSQADADDRRVA
ncbi:MAG: sterol desaturase family protein [Pirellulales bacterium]